MGIPQFFITNNGAYVSLNVMILLNFVKNDVKQLFSPLHRPQSEGAAESFVKTFKDKFKKILHLNLECKDSEINRIVNSFLIDYRFVINETTGVAPNQLQINRKVNSHSDIINEV